MKVLVCGGRGYGDVEAVARALGVLGPAVTMIIEGNARGADQLAGEWAAAHGIHYASVPALWHIHNKAAGALRNAAMLELGPDLCVAFPGGTGTDDMVRRCEAAGVAVIRVAV